jgi:hypothetical protein
VQERQPYSDEANNHGGDERDDNPPKVMVLAFLTKPLHLGLVAHPTKRCLFRRFVGQTSMEKAVAAFTGALELGALCSLHFWLRHQTLARHDTKKRASVCNHSPMMRARCSRPILRENIIGDIVAFDVQRLLNEAGSLIAVVAVDRISGTINPNNPTRSAECFGWANPQSAALANTMKAGLRRY